MVKGRDVRSERSRFSEAEKLLRVISGKVTEGMKSQRDRPSTPDFRALRSRGQSFFLELMIKRKEEATTSFSWAFFNDCFSHYLE